MRRILAALAAFACFGGLHAVAQPALESLSTGADGRGWEGVGRLDIGGNSFCTGSLIRDDVVLTAAHCVVDTATGAPIPVREITFLAGWRNGRADSYRQVRRAVISPSFEGRGDGTVMVPGDVAILELARPIRNGRTLPFLTGAMPRTGTRIGIVSYARGRSEAPSLQAGCNALRTGGGMMVTDCEADFGASGSPIFDLSGVQARIVSVVSAKATDGERPIALGAELGPTLDGLLAQLGRSTIDPPRAVASAPVRVVTLERSRASSGAKFLRPSE